MISGNHSLEVDIALLLQTFHMDKYKASQGGRQLTCEDLPLCSVGKDGFVKSLKHKQWITLRKKYSKKGNVSLGSYYQSQLV